MTKFELKIVFMYSNYNLTKHLKKIIENSSIVLNISDRG